MNKKVLAIATLLTIVNIAGIVYGTTVPTAASGNITVTAVAPFTANSASLAGTACTISADKLTVTCPGVASLPGGNTVALVMSVTNNAQISQAIPAPVVTFTSSGTNTSIYLTVSPVQSYPLTVAAGSASTLTFNIQGSTANQGTDSFSLSP